MVEEVIETCSCIRELHRKCEMERVVPGPTPDLRQLRESAHGLDPLPGRRRLQALPETQIDRLSSKVPVGEWLFKDPEMGPVAYTISILLMFSLVIIMLMVRSIRRTNSAVEMDALLDAMRFREELDLRERQRRRLLRAKNKVTAWLTRTDNAKNGPPSSMSWQNSPQLMHPRKNYSYSSTVSEIPEIVVTDDALIRRSNTPCLSLIYDFNERKESTGSMVRSQAGSQRPSVCSVMSDSAHRKGSYSLDHDITAGSRDGLMDSHQSLSFG